MITEKQIEDVVKSTITQLIETEKAALTVQECAKYTGIGVDKIRELVAKENTDFPFLKVGIKTLIPRAALKKWLEKVSTEKRTL